MHIDDFSQAGEDQIRGTRQCPDMQSVTIPERMNNPTHEYLGARVS